MYRYMKIQTWYESIKFNENESVIMEYKITWNKESCHKNGQGGVYYVLTLFVHFIL